MLELHVLRHFVSPPSARHLFPGAQLASLHTVGSVEEHAADTTTAATTPMPMNERTSSKSVPRDLASIMMGGVITAAQEPAQ